MPRPQLYHTPEEKAAANRAKSKRSYDKYKSHINAHRRSSHRAENPSSVPRPYRRPKRQNKIKITFQPRSLDDITGGVPPSDFLENLVQAYTSSSASDDSIFSVPLAALEVHLKDLQQVEGHVLQEDGAGEKWRVAQQSTQTVQALVRAVEELICSCLVGSITTTHKTHRFMYQN
ncbi:hypothetical protein BDN72DRAFT_899681 [Pluteus cervinus]|uniref:Uncharacterized protein n=1 Tax=Pluteus cervinus TaxID=181527 RepID=A0ACD3ALR1_9AGAR|nr:hypothetical protein BDN72DRAFT_899681 [Pluteus cervinus]